VQTAHNRKKTLIVAIAVTLAVLLLAVLIPLIILQIDDMGRGPHMTIHFADPALSDDIYADAEYMSLNRAINYTTTEGYTVTVEIPESDYVRYSDEVQLLIRLVEAAIAGDNIAYNSCFTPEYIAASGAEEPFTMQKIYDIEIVNYHSSAAVEKEHAEIYKNAAVYGLRYKIKDNNGSLRYDMGSDAVHEQYISVVTDAEGNALIYGVQMHQTR
jgi:hypothetical protein